MFETQHVTCSMVTTRSRYARIDIASTLLERCLDDVFGQLWGLDWGCRPIWNMWAFWRHAWVFQTTAPCTCTGSTTAATYQSSVASKHLFPNSSKFQQVAETTADRYLQPGGKAVGTVLFAIVLFLWMLCERKMERVPQSHLFRSFSFFYVGLWMILWIHNLKTCHVADFL